MRKCCECKVRLLVTNRVYNFKLTNFPDHCDFTLRTAAVLVHSSFIGVCWNAQRRGGQCGCKWHSPSVRLPQRSADVLLFGAPILSAIPSVPTSSTLNSSHAWSTEDQRMPCRATAVAQRSSNALRNHPSALPAPTAVRNAITVARLSGRH